MRSKLRPLILATFSVLLILMYQNCGEGLSSPLVEIASLESGKSTASIEKIKQLSENLHNNQNLLFKAEVIGEQDSLSFYWSYRCGESALNSIDKSGESYPEELQVNCPEAGNLYISLSLKNNAGEVVAVSQENFAVLDPSSSGDNPNPGPGGEFVEPTINLIEKASSAILNEIFLSKILINNPSSASNLNLHVQIMCPQYYNYLFADPIPVSYDALNLNLSCPSIEGSSLVRDIIKIKLSLSFDEGDGVSEELYFEIPLAEVSP